MEADEFRRSRPESARRSPRIGITGPPGAGKSTLTCALVEAWRADGKTVAVLAVDPSSPRTGGALLGDRIRMERIALDEGVFIRSMATRGATGGIAAATAAACEVLDAAGFDRIVVETVGVGQAEIAVVGQVDTTVLVLVPESGDGIQTLKAGILEVADVLVVNKADRPQAEAMVRDLEASIAIREGRLTDTVPGGGTGEAWRPPVLATVAVRNAGVAEVRAAIERHLGRTHSSL